MVETAEGERRMSGLNNNANLPKHIYGYLRTEYCNNLKAGDRDQSAEMALRN